MGTTTTTVREKRTLRGRPWEMWPTLGIEVPGHEWTWVFSLTQGTPVVLEQKFEHERNPKTGKSVSRTVVSPPHNPHNDPVISWQQVQRIFDDSQNNQVSHRRLFLKMYDRNKLSNEQLEILSEAQDVFTAGPDEGTRKADREKRSAKAAAFLAEVEGGSPAGADSVAEVAAAAPEKRGPGRPRKVVTETV